MDGPFHTRAHRFVQAQNFVDSFYAMDDDGFGERFGIFELADEHLTLACVVAAQPVEPALADGDGFGSHSEFLKTFKQVLERRVGIHVPWVDACRVCGTRPPLVGMQQVVRRDLDDGRRWSLLVVGVEVYGCHGEGLGRSCRGRGAMVQGRSRALRTDGSAIYAVQPATGLSGGRVFGLLRAHRLNRSA